MNSAAPPTDSNVPTKAEAKKLRRSRRLASQDDTNALPQPFLELGASNKAKLRHRREMRAWKYQQKHPGVDVPKELTTKSVQEQIRKHQESKKMNSGLGDGRDGGNGR
jgi:hypothetical protein